MKDRTYWEKEHNELLKHIEKYFNDTNIQDEDRKISSVIIAVKVIVKTTDTYQEVIERIEQIKSKFKPSDLENQTQMN